MLNDTPVYRLAGVRSAQDAGSTMPRRGVKTRGHRRVRRPMRIGTNSRNRSDTRTIRILVRISPRIQGEEGALISTAWSRTRATTRIAGTTRRIPQNVCRARCAAASCCSARALALTAASAPTSAARIAQGQGAEAVGHRVGRRGKVVAGGEGEGRWRGAR